MQGIYKYINENTVVEPNENIENLNEYISETLVENSIFWTEVRDEIHEYELREAAYILTDDAEALKSLREGLLGSLSKKVVRQIEKVSDKINEIIQNIRLKHSGLTDEEKDMLHFVMSSEFGMPENIKVKGCIDYDLSKIAKVDRSIELKLYDYWDERGKTYQEAIDDTFKIFRAKKPEDVKVNDKSYKNMVKAYPNDGDKLRGVFLGAKGKKIKRKDFGKTFKDMANIDKPKTFTEKDIDVLDINDNLIRLKSFINNFENKLVYINNINTNILSRLNDDALRIDRSLGLEEDQSKLLVEIMKYLIETTKYAEEVRLDSTKEVVEIYTNLRKQNIKILKALYKASKK